MMSTEFISLNCRADIDVLDHLADRSVNKKLLQELLGCSNIVSESGDGTIWQHEAASSGVFYYVNRSAPETIGLYVPYRLIDLSPGLSSIEASCWQCSAMSGWRPGWRDARDEVFGELLRRIPLVVSSDRLREQSGWRFWEDLVGKTILSGGQGGIVRDGVLIFEEHWSWFAPEHLGRDGGSRFFVQRPRSNTQTAGKDA